MSDPLMQAQTILRSALDGRVRTEYPIAPLTSLRVGGPAALFLDVEAQADLDRIFEFNFERDPATGLTRDPVFMKETLANPTSPDRQGAGTIHVHPNGRFVYLTNRASRLVDFEGKKVFAGGENSIAVFAIDYRGFGLSTDALPCARRRTSSPARRARSPESIAAASTASSSCSSRASR
jgi:hypothetical protein